MANRHKNGAAVWGLMLEVETALERMLNPTDPAVSAVDEAGLPVTIPADPTGGDEYLPVEIFGCPAVPSGMYVEILPYGVLQEDIIEGFAPEVDEGHTVSLQLNISLRGFGSGDEFVRSAFIASFNLTEILRPGRYLPIPVVLPVTNGAALEVLDVKEAALFSADSAGEKGYNYLQEILCRLHFKVKGE